jgi:uncharacterized membrane protein
MDSSLLKTVDVSGLITRVVLVLFFVFLVTLSLEKGYQVSTAFYVLAAIVSAVVILGTKVRKEVHKVRYHQQIKD